jgi:hypothetical protein
MKKILIALVALWTSIPALLVAQRADKFTIIGTWAISDSRGGGPITSVTLSGNNGYLGGAWGRDFGGPNGIGANQYRYDNDTLSFIYVMPGRARIDEMVTGNVKVLSPSEFDFTVSGGYYGTGRNLGFVFKFKK